MTAASAPAASTPTVEAPRLLDFSSGYAYALVIAFTAANAVFVSLNQDSLGQPIAGWLALVIITGAALLLVRGREEKLALNSAVAIVLAAIVVTALILETLQPDPDGAFGRAEWFRSSNTLLLTFVALRSRPVLAVIGYLGMAGVEVLLLGAAGEAPLDGILPLLDVRTVSIIGGVLLNRILVVSRRGIDEANRRATDIESRARADRQVAALRRQRMEEVMATAGDALTRVARGGPFSEEHIREFTVAEAALRDGVRARTLTELDGVEKATRDARLRGVAVTLLDDRGEPGLSAGESAEVRRATVAALAGAAAGETLTVRLLPPDRAETATIVAESGAGIRRSAVSPAH